MSKSNTSPIKLLICSVIATIISIDIGLLAVGKAGFADQPARAEAGGALTNSNASNNPMSEVEKEEVETARPSKWWKGNLHAHSFWSDGNDFPEMIAKWYHDQGYNFLALTDHNVLSAGERWIDEATIVKRGGEEALEKYRSAWEDGWIETRQVALPKKKPAEKKPAEKQKVEAVKSDEGSNSDAGDEQESNASESGKTEPGKIESGKIESGKTESGKTESGKTESGKTESTESIETQATEPEAVQFKTQYRLKTLEEFRPKFESPGQFLMMQGEEISDKAAGVPIHMNATNLLSVIRPVGGETPREAINNNLRAVQEQADQYQRPILVHLNHPNFGWAVTAEDLAAVTNERFFEVYNGHPGINHLGDDSRPSVERMWDIANTIRVGELNAPPMFGLGTDDGHHYHGKQTARPGRGWVMVRSASLEPAALISAMNEGDFYCSSGVTLADVKFDRESRTISLVIDPDDDATYRTQFIGTRKNYDQESLPRIDSDGKPIRATRIYSKDVGQVLATDESLSPTYHLQGDELFVRAVITSSLAHADESFKDQKQQAWTQPVGWDLGGEGR